MRHMAEKVLSGARLRYWPRLNSHSIMGIPQSANMVKYGIRNVAEQNIYIKKTNYLKIDIYDLIFNIHWL